MGSRRVYAASRIGISQPRGPDSRTTVGGGFWRADFRAGRAVAPPFAARPVAPRFPAPCFREERLRDVPVRRFAQYAVSMTGDGDVARELDAFELTYATVK